VRIVPGAQVLPRHLVDPDADADATPVEANTTAEAERLLGLENAPHAREEE
jgi:hypothetical protein